jgi:AcrR family transcriptional regulator
MASRPVTTDRRERLLQAGVEVFGSGGYEDVSTETIAERAGVAQGLLFHYFGTKKKFFAAVMARVMENMEAGFDANTHADPKRWLRQEIEIFLFGLLEHPPSQIAEGVGFTAELLQVMEAHQARAAARIIDRMGIAEPTPLTLLAVRGWVAGALTAGRLWLQTREVGRPVIRALLIASLNDALAHVAAAEPASGVVAGFFAGA